MELQKGCNKRCSQALCSLHAQTPSPPAFLRSFVIERHSGQALSQGERGDNSCGQWQRLCRCHCPTQEKQIVRDPKPHNDEDLCWNICSVWMVRQKMRGVKGSGWSGDCKADTIFRGVERGDARASRITLYRKLKNPTGMFPLDFCFG